MISLDAASVDTFGRAFNEGSNDLMTMDWSNVTTKPVLICKMVYLIHPMLFDVSNILQRVRRLKDMQPMFEPFSCIFDDISLEMLGIRAWCSELRLLHRDDIAADSFSMSWEIAMDCVKTLTAVDTFTKKTDLLLTEIEEKTRLPTIENAMSMLEDFPDQAARIIRLHGMLEDVVMGLGNVNKNIEDGREMAPMRSGLHFRPDDEPLKQMWLAAVEGLRMVAKEHQTAVWEELQDKVYCWGCEQFQDPFPLDLYFDYTVSGQPCRKTLHTGLFYILYFTGKSFHFFVHLDDVLIQ